MRLQHHIYIRHPYVFCSKRARIERVASRALADLELCAPVSPSPLNPHFLRGVYRDAVNYVQQCMLGPIFYGMPFARRSDDEKSS